MLAPRHCKLVAIGFVRQSARREKDTAAIEASRAGRKWLETAGAGAR
jgi:hypothetical protein